MRAVAPIALLATVSIAGLYACAPTPTRDMDGAPRAEHQCFDADRVNNFRVARDQTIYVREHGDKVFELQTTGACTELDSTFGIALVPGTGSISRLCTGDSTNVVVRGQTRGTGPCRARVVGLLTDEQVALLPERDRP